ATVLENDPFDIAHLEDRNAIQRALADTAARLACNHMDFKRAALLLQALQIASNNLTAYEKTQQSAQDRAAAAIPPGTAAEPVILSEEQRDLSEEQRDESKNPDAAPSTATAPTLLPPTITLQAVAANQQPAPGTHNQQPRTHLEP
ncbi:MAG TPA: hypothetical protein VGN01_01470, partial [Acidobacteriaceae bacterium]